MKNLCRFVHPLVEGFASVRWKHGFCLMEAWFLPNESGQAGAVYACSVEFVIRLP
jgi:hypothetical protein